MKEVIKKAYLALVTFLSWTIWIFALMYMQYLEGSGQITIEGLDMYSGYILFGGALAVFIMGIAVAMEQVSRQINKLIEQIKDARSKEQ